jgi:hypothetical protein
MVCFRYITVNAPHKGDYDDDAANNNNPIIIIIIIIISQTL